MCPEHARYCRTQRQSLCPCCTTLSPSVSPTLWLGQVRVGLEEPEAGSYQRRVGQMRLLGELYNYRILDSKCAPARALLFSIAQALHACFSLASSLLLLPSMFPAVRSGQLSHPACWYAAQGQSPPAV